MANKLNKVADEVVHAYVKGGHTLDEIAATYGCSQGTVRNLLAAQGVPRRLRGRRKTVKTEPVSTLPIDKLTNDVSTPDIGGPVTDDLPTQGEDVLRISQV
jgi:predicted transcriptional regulator